MYILGIDVGASGAIVVLKQDGSYVDHLIMPTIKNGKTTTVNGYAIRNFLNSYITSGDIDHAYIEQVHAMPMQGRTSMFNFGYSAGMIEGIMAGSHISCSMITPQKWKKFQGIPSGSDKDASRSKVVRPYSMIKDLSQKAKGQAIGDAILIALTGLNIKL